MKIAYFDCSSGISGDMILSSFINSGIDAKRLEKYLKKSLNIGKWGFLVKKVKKGHAMATQIAVTGQKNFRDAAEMRRLAAKSRLDSRVKADTLKILDVLIAAESKIHGIRSSKVHFHEMNSVDTIIDAAGAAACFRQEGISKAFVSALNLGSPAPATLEIVKTKKIPVFSNTAGFELTTPTGAAIASVLMEPAATPPVMEVEKFGFGAGMAEIPGSPNILKLLIGKAADEVIARSEATKQSHSLEYIILLETNIDDMDPRVFPYVTEKLLKSGALDAWLTSVIMKKGRPGIVLSVLSKPPDELKLADLIFRETTTTGIRRSVLSRHLLRREQKGVYKTAWLPDGSQKTAIEFEKAKKMAEKPASPPLYKVLKKP